MAENRGMKGNLPKIGLSGFLIGGLLALPLAVLVYYVAVRTNAQQPIVGASIFYVLMYIAFTSAYYFARIRLLKRKYHVRWGPDGYGSYLEEDLSTADTEENNDT